MATPIDFHVFVAIWNQSLGGNNLILPDVHERIAKWLQATDREKKRVLMAYRGCGKSSLQDLYIAWRLYCDPNTTHLLLSATTALSSTASHDIKLIIESHPLTGHLVPDKNSGHWQNTNFTIVRPYHRREPSVRCSSLGSKITGFRADMVIADDLEVHNNVNTDEMRQKLRDTAREIQSIAKKGVLYIGTPHEEDSIYSTLEYKWGYLTEKFPIIKSDGTPQSPDMHDAQWIEDKKIAGDDDLGTHNWWQSQYMLIPVRSTMGQLNWERVKFIKGEVTTARHPNARGETIDQIDGKMIRSKRAYWDPATGNKGQDESVIVYCAKTYDNEILVIDALVLPPVHDERGMQDQFDAVLAFMKKHKLRQITVEKNFSYTLATELRRRAKEKGAVISITEATRTNKQNKEEFITRTIEPFVNVGKFYVHENVLTATSFRRQFQDFPNSKHDDALDATAGCIGALGQSVGVGIGSGGYSGGGVVNGYEPVWRF